MLHIIYGDIELYNQRYGTDYGTVYRINEWFDNKYKTDWLNTDFTKRAIKEIDKSEHIQDHLIMSPILGAISPRELSGGVKTVITLMYDNLKDSGNPIFLTSVNCGDNCTNKILEIANIKDVYLNVEHYLKFISKHNFKAKIWNTGEVIENDIDKLNLSIVLVKQEYQLYINSIESI